jgi:hypothetical protein
MPSEWIPDEWSGAESPAEAGLAGEEERRAELRELEDELCRLTGVLAVRVVGDRVGRPIEVHVLADQSKPPKQTVRDVRSVAQTMFGLELDHRIVSVAQLDGPDAPSTEPEATRPGARARVARVQVEAQGLRAQARVVLIDGEEERTGFSESSVASAARAHLVASATLDAVRQIDRSADSVHISSADVTRAGAARVAVVTVVYVEPPMELVVSGSAVVRGDRDDAVARALLDATNRRLHQVEARRAGR